MLIGHPDSTLAVDGCILKLQVEMEAMATKEKYVFNCGRWLADDEDDHSIVRELPAKGPGIKKPLPCKFIWAQFVKINNIVS